MMKNLPKIALGAWAWGNDGTFGNNFTAEQLRPIFDTAMKNGLNLWDTAFAYGMGTSEKVLAGFIKDLPRESYLISDNCFAWQLAKANAFAEKEGFAKFVSVQGHYNLIFREEEREMVPFCEEENIALTPYSALASGRLSRKPGVDNTKRASEDAYAKFKYDATAEQDNIIIARVAELAEKHGVTMTEISLAWLLTKVTSPVVGATKLHHIEGAAKSVDLELTDEELSYLEEPYVPHPLAGVMAQNKPSDAGKKHVWSTGDQKIKNV